LNRSLRTDVTFSLFKVRIKIKRINVYALLDFKKGTNSGKILVFIPSFVNSTEQQTLQFNLKKNDKQIEKEMF